MHMNSHEAERRDWKNKFFNQQVWIGKKSNPKVREQAMHITNRRQTNNLTWKGFLATRQKNWEQTKETQCMTCDKDKRKGNIEKKTRIDNQPNHHDANDFQWIQEERLETNKYCKKEKFWNKPWTSRTRIIKILHTKQTQEMTCDKSKRGSMLKHQEGMDSIPNIHDANQSMAWM